MTLVDGSPAQRFAAIYEASYGAIHDYVSRRVGSAAADDIVAETFLVAWRKLDALPTEPLPWLYGVARNVVRRHQALSVRRQHATDALRREHVFLEPARAEDENPRFWAAWAQLRPLDREVLGLVAWEGLTVADAAVALGCSAPVFSVRLHRARRRLDRLLAAAGRGPVPSSEFTEA